VVNTAGIMLLSPLAELDLADFARMFLDGKDQQTIDHLAALPPLERLGRPGDIAETVAFLAGPARWINGQVIYANGGVI
jgi:3-oxoacyl-[acyl-carrier protein] reductase